MDITQEQPQIGDKLQKHKEVLNNQCRPDIISVLVGNKSDIPLKKIRKEIARKLASRH